MRCLSPEKQAARAVAALAITIATSGCSSDSTSSGPDTASGGTGTALPDAPATGGGGTGGAASGIGGGTTGGDAGGPSDLPSLYTDPEIPTCQVGSAADLQIQGTIAGQAVAMQWIPTSNIAGGDLQVMNSVPTDTGYELRIDLELTWSGSLSEGTVTPLDGGSLYLREDQPGGGQFYCFSSGELGPLPASDQPAEGGGKSFKFRVGSLALNADCSGGPVAGELVGCIYRLNSYLP
jgi:hypothetical protein